MVTFFCQLPVNVKEAITSIMADAIVLLSNNPGTLRDMPPRTDRENNIITSDVDLAGVRALIASGAVGWKPEFVKYKRIQWEGEQVDPRPALGKLIHTAYPSLNAFEGTGGFFYEEGGCQSWHTNYDEDAVGRTLRIYFCKNDDANSEFRTYDAATDSVIIHHEPVGWSANVFDLTTPFWHAVKSGVGRTSIGVGFKYN